jgi:formylglycine-generating enzyme required for sulfatase activity
MRCWFLSYNSQDLALMQAFEEALRRKDTEAQFFFAPKSLRAGGYWLPELAKQIAEATAFVLLVGEKGLGPWQVTEYYEALDRRVKETNFPVVFVLLDGQPAPGLPFLRQLHWIITADPASEKSLAQVIDAAAGGGEIPGELWRHTAPYRGLAAMTEADSDFFFGRGRETVNVLSALAAGPDRLPVLLGNSGVGKSSLAQAGVLAALKRQAWPEESGAPNAWPEVFEGSRGWCFLTLKPGTEPLKALVETFLDTWQFSATDPERVKHQNGWIELLRDGKATLRDLLDATERRHGELDRSKPPAFFLYVDQGEELYVRSEEHERQRFSEILAHALSDPRLRAMMSMRSDFLGGLQNDEPLFNVHRQINVPPLREAELRNVVSRPAELLSARFETPGLIDLITRRTAEDSVKDVGALPLLSYTLDDMWTQMAKDGEGVLRLPTQSFELGGVLVDRANTFLATHPGAENILRRVLTLRLADVHEDGEPTRRRALRSEFSADEWRLVSDLADFPNRLLVTATSESGETYAEVAHEAIFRRWQKLREWIAAEREFLAWRSGLEAARRAWQAAPNASKSDALLMGLALTQAQSWLARRSGDISTTDRGFVSLSGVAAQRRRRRMQALVGVPTFAIVVVLIGWLNQTYVLERWRWFTVIRPYMTTQVRPYVLTADAERALKPGDSFKECAKDCPEMVVIPAGSFMMGSPTTEKNRDENEGPQHKVSVDKPFAISKFEATFDDWDACVAYGDCPHVSDSTFGRGRRPVINVTWDDAQTYVAWLSRMTGKSYRLLSEAEWEYAARAGTSSRYSFGDDESGLGQYGWYAANSGGKTHEVGEKLPNAFGLFDMHGNAWEWVEDCYGPYAQEPMNSSARTDGDCSRRVVRGGSWYYDFQKLRSATRDKNSTDNRFNSLGFRVGRTLPP